MLTNFNFLHLKLPAILFALALNPAVFASNPVFFQPASAYNSGDRETSSVAGADINADGKADLVVVNGCGSGITCLAEGSVGVLLGNGDGTFQPVVKYLSHGWNASSVAIADVNGDNKLDIVVANECTTRATVCPGQASIAVLLGNGDGTFQPAITYSSGGWNANSVIVGDVNADGQPDMLVANGCASAVDCSNNGALAVLLGNGNGTFQAAALYSSGGAGATSAVIEDIDGDGKSDVVVTNCGCHNGSFFNRCSIGVLLGNGDGSFRRPVDYDSGGNNPWGLAVTDFNHDGSPDVIATNSCWCLSHGTVAVLVNNGDGTFQPAVTYDSGGNLPFSIAVADFNGDGISDLAIADRCRDSDCGTNAVVGVLLGKQDHTFAAAVVFDAGGDFTNSVAVADVNDDKKPDLLTAINGGVSVLLNDSAIVVDSTPPVITVFATPKVLWPPNGKMVRVKISGVVTDMGSGVDLTSATYVVTDEYLEVQPRGAISLTSGGRYSFVILLQASRRGSDFNGRNYRIRIRAKDNAGNASFATAVIIVPHQR